MSLFIWYNDSYQTIIEAGNVRFLGLKPNQTKPGQWLNKLQMAGNEGSRRDHKSEYKKGVQMTKQTEENRLSSLSSGYSEEIQMTIFQSHDYLMM